jgi:hypothetical protein
MRGGCHALGGGADKETPLDMQVAEADSGSEAQVVKSVVKSGVKMGGGIVTVEEKRGGETTFFEDAVGGGVS